MGIGQILSYATRRIKPNQIRIRKRELDASNNRSFASEFVSSDYEVTGLLAIANRMPSELPIIHKDDDRSAHQQSNPQQPVLGLGTKLVVDISTNVVSN